MILLSAEMSIHPQQNWIMLRVGSTRLHPQAQFIFGRSELVAAGEWSLCVVSCRVGWMAAACGAGSRVSGAGGWRVRVLGGSGVGAEVRFG